MSLIFVALVHKLDSISLEIWIRLWQSVDYFRKYVMSKAMCYLPEYQHRIYENHARTKEQMLHKLLLLHTLHVFYI